MRQPIRHWNLHLLKYYRITQAPAFKTTPPPLFGLVLLQTQGKGRDLPKRGWKHYLVSKSRVTFVSHGSKSTCQPSLDSRLAMLQPSTSKAIILQYIHGARWLHIFKCKTEVGELVDYTWLYLQEAQPKSWKNCLIIWFNFELFLLKKFRNFNQNINLCIVWRI